MAERLGAHSLVDAFKAQGVNSIFTLSGNHIMPIFDAVIDQPIKLIHTRHEAATVHMADAYARLSGKVGIAMVTGGPGHANAVSALYTAAMAEAPVVLLSGHAPLNQLGKGAFQEMSQADIAAPLCKASWTCAGPTSPFGQRKRNGLWLLVNAIFMKYSVLVKMPAMKTLKRLIANWP